MDAIIKKYDDIVHRRNGLQEQIEALEKNLAEKKRIHNLMGEILAEMDRTNEVMDGEWDKDFGL